MSVRYQHIIVSLRRTLRIQNCIQSLPCFFPSLLGFCFEGVGLGSPTHEPPLPFSWSSFDPLPTASQISAAPSSQRQIVHPHQPSSSSQLSSQSISDCPSDSDGRQRLQAYLYAAPPWRHEEDAHRSWGRAGIWLLSCRRTAAATPTTQPAPHPRRSRLMLWTRRRAWGFQHKDERRPTK